MTEYMQEVIDRLKENRPVSDEVIALYAISGHVDRLADVSENIHETLIAMNEKLRWIEGHLDTLASKEGDV